jgi:ATP-dependent Zn protease
LNELYGKTRGLIRTHIAALDHLAGALLENEALDGQAAERILDEALSNDRRKTA